jgi:16S rRNA (cytosine1402-N4)-methyltransferase
MATRHVPVMLNEVLQTFANTKGNFLDCTLGGGGHTEAILKQSQENIVHAIDRDGEAIERAKERLKPYLDRIKFYNCAFSKFNENLVRDSINKDTVSQIKFSGVIADLGLSTDQLFSGRGFSFNDDASLDMRMSTSSEILNANELLASMSEGEIFKMLKIGGVGNEARKIAKAISDNLPLKSAANLSEVVAKVHKPSYKGITSKKFINPATVVLQAIRIAVNDELGEIERLLAKIPSYVQAGTKMVVISFHSLEDQIVTKILREWSRGDTTPANLRSSFLGKGLIDNATIGRLLTKKAITPSQEEVASNTSARSARMRVFEFFK